jgi:hypothetical protein
MRTEITIRRLLPLSVLAARVLLGQPLQIRTQELPWAIVGAVYHEKIETGIDGRCPGGDVEMAVTGKLPRGLDLRGEFLTGTAKQIGNFKLHIRAANTCSSAEKDLNLVVTGKPILRVYPEALLFQFGAGQDAPAMQSVRVSATWPDLAYAVTGDAAWVVPKRRGGVIPAADAGLSSDLVSVAVAPQDLKPGVYRTALRFSTWNGANSPEVAVTLIVLPTP